MSVRRCDRLRAWRVGLAGCLASVGLAAAPRLAVAEPGRFDAAAVPRGSGWWCPKPLGSLPTGECTRGRASCTRGAAGAGCARATSVFAFSAAVYDRPSAFAYDSRASCEAALRGYADDPDLSARVTERSACVALDRRGKVLLLEPGRGFWCIDQTVGYETSHCARTAEACQRIAATFGGECTGSAEAWASLHDEPGEEPSLRLARTREHCENHRMALGGGDCKKVR